MQHQPKTPLPRIEPRKGFGWLPQAQKFAVIALVALLLFAVLPAWIDSGRAGSGQLKAALFKPRSVAAALTRMERHYGLGWTTGSAGERRVRVQIAAISLALCAVGAWTGAKAQPGATPAPVSTTTPRMYGAASPIRARAALTHLREDDHV